MDLHFKIEDMKTAALRPWNKLINTGIQPDTPAVEKKLTRFTNIVASLTSFAILLYVPFSFLNGNYLLGVIEIVDALLVFSAVWFNYKGWHHTARFAYLLVVNVFVLINSCYIGFNSRVHEFFYISNILPFIMFQTRDYKRIAAGIVMAVSGFATFHAIHPYFTRFNLDAASQQNIYVINMIMMFILFSLAMYILAFYNHQAERELALVNQKLQKHAEELKRSNQDLEEFAYIISHDMKVPVRNISSFLSLFISRHGKGVAQEGMEFLEHSKQSANRLGNLIDDMLEYSRLGRNLPKPKPTDVNLLLLTISAEMSHRLEERNASIRIADEMPVLLGVHSTMVYHVFQNLITNGIKFNQSIAPEVSVCYLDEKEQHHFSVCDNGIGIPAEHAEHLFHMFRRLHTTEYEGTGIGLAICKKIIQHYNGRIWIESKAGEGTTFHFTLPKLNGETEPLREAVLPVEFAVAA